MPKEFLKMADMFCGDVSHYGTGNYMADANGYCGEFLKPEHTLYAVHAITSHDELVRQRDELKEVLQDLMDWTVRNVDAPDCEPYNRATRLLNQIGG